MLCVLSSQFHSWHIKKRAVFSPTLISKSSLLDFLCKPPCGRFTECPPSVFGLKIHSWTVKCSVRKQSEAPSNKLLCINTWSPHYYLHQQLLPPQVGEESHVTDGEHGSTLFEFIDILLPNLKLKMNFQHEICTNKKLQRVWRQRKGAAAPRWRSVCKTERHKMNYLLKLKQES